MRVLSTVTRVGLATSAALVLALAPAGEAMAAQGEFRYYSAEGEPLVLTNPEDGECFLLVGGAEWVENATDKVAMVFEDHGCEGPAVWVWPGDDVDFAQPYPHSVKFG